MTDYGPYAVVREVPSYSEILAASQDEMSALADVCVEESQIVCPIDTGRLMQSIRSDRDGYVVEIIAGGIIVRAKLVNYAEVVHEGTGAGRNSVPRPFLDQGIEAGLIRFRTLQEQRQYESFDGIDLLVRDPFGTRMMYQSDVLLRYSAGSNVFGFGGTLIGRVPAGQTFGKSRGGQFFSLESFRS